MCMWHPCSEHLFVSCLFFYRVVHNVDEPDDVKKLPNEVSQPSIPETDEQEPRIIEIPGVDDV